MAIFCIARKRKSRRGFTERHTSALQHSSSNKMFGHNLPMFPILEWFPMLCCQSLFTTLLVTMSEATVNFFVRISLTDEQWFGVLCIIPNAVKWTPSETQTHHVRNDNRTGDLRLCKRRAWPKFSSDFLFARRTFIFCTQRYQVEPSQPPSNPLNCEVDKYHTLA